MTENRECLPLRRGVRLCLTCGVEQTWGLPGPGFTDDFSCDTGALTTLAGDTQAVADILQVGGTFADGLANLAVGDALA